MAMASDGNPTYIYSRDGLLTFDSADEDSNPLPLATKDEYELGDRCVGSIFEALEPEEHVKLADGYFVLDDELDLDELLATCYARSEFLTPQRP